MGKARENLFQDRWKPRAYSLDETDINSSPARGGWTGRNEKNHGPCPWESI